MTKKAVFFSIVDAIQGHATARKDATALLGTERRITYGELNVRSNRIAEGLRQLGVQQDERICYLGRNTVEFFEIFIACAKVGAVAVPLNWRLAPPELQAIAIDTNASIIFATEEFAGIDGLTSGGRPFRTAIVIGRDRSALGFEEWLNQQAEIESPFRPLKGDVAVQIYSSGTTGLPKGVMLSHGAYHYLMGYQTDEWPEWLSWTPEDTILVVTPVFHISGLAWGLRSLCSGGVALVREKLDAEGIVSLVEQYKITRLPMVPTTLQLLIERVRSGKVNLSSLKHIQYGAAPIAYETLLEVIRTLKCDLVQTYGMTETGFGVVALSPKDHDPENPDRLASKGTPLPGVELRIVDGAGKDVPCGVSGQIAIRSPSNMVGYWKRPEETARVLDKDGWLLSGDAGYLDEQGYLHLNGRINEMIITGGENVYPLEVENVLVGHPSVRDAAVVGLPSSHWGEVVAGFIVLDRDNLRKEELFEYVRSKIAGYKVPKEIHFLDCLPLNGAGKVDKKKLKELLLVE